MTELNAKAVQLLLAGHEDHIPQFAEHFDVPEGMAKGLRMFWNRALTGKCTTCGTPTKGAKKCRTCKRRNPTLLDPRSSVALLRDMNPRNPAYRDTCVRCGGVVWYSAGHVLKKCRRFGFFRPPSTPICVHCVNAERRKPVGLTHRPFEELINGR